MSTQEEKVSAVAACVLLYADLEQLLDEAKGKVDQLCSAIDEAHRLGIGRQGEHLRVVNGLQHARGMVAAALERVIEIHEKCTAIAKRENCDTALPANGFAISIMSGGDR